MRNLLCAVSVISCICIANACQKAVSYPPEPQISLQSYTFVDTIDKNSSQIKEKLLTLTLNFTDGDGDLFTQYIDTSTTNLRSKVHLSFYKKENGVFTLVPDSFWRVPYNFSLPYSDVVERTGQNKTQKGTIELNSIFLPYFPFDTVQVECFVTDLENHQSNTVRLPKELVFN